MEIHIDGETADRIVVASLSETIDWLKIQIKRLQKKKKLADYEKTDLVELIRSLNAMEEVYDYYGGNVR